MISMPSRISLVVPVFNAVQPRLNPSLKECTMPANIAADSPSSTSLVKPTARFAVPIPSARALVATELARKVTLLDRLVTWVPSADNKPFLYVLSQRSPTIPTFDTLLINPSLAASSLSVTNLFTRIFRFSGICGSASIAFISASLTPGIFTFLPLRISWAIAGLTLILPAAVAWAPAVRMPMYVSNMELWMLNTLSNCAWFSGVNPLV